MSIHIHVWPNMSCFLFHGFLSFLYSRLLILYLTQAYLLFWWCFWYLLFNLLHLLQILPLFFCSSFSFVFFIPSLSFSKCTTELIDCLWVATSSLKFVFKLEHQGKEFKWSTITVLLAYFPHSSVSKESVCNEGYPDLIPVLVRYSGEGNGNPLQYSCLENSMGRGAWQAAVHRVTRVDMI